MRLPLLLVLLALPLLEIGVLIKTGQWLGFWMTLGVILATGVLGTAVLVNQGFQAPLRMQEAMARGEAPIASMFDGALAWLAGFLLITPGLIADALGLLLLIPALRRIAAGWIGRQFFGLANINVEIRTARSAAASGARPHAGDDGTAEGSGDAGPVIEGEFERIGERTIDPNRPGAGDRERR